MKKGFKIFGAVAVASASALALASCGSSADYTVGILQYATHDALDKATEGFKTAIEAAAKEKGKTVKFIEKNPEGDATTMATMATNLVRDCDLVLGNATPAATALKAAAATEGKNALPILFTSVTDPVSSKLLSNKNAPEGQLTGTSDMNPVADQSQLMVDLIGKKDLKVGFLYTASEDNSKTQCDLAKAYLDSLITSDSTYSITTATRTINDQGGLNSAVTALCDTDKVDVIYIPTDNLVASNMSAVTNVTNEKKIPTICGEESMVTNGGTMTLSISYLELGKVTGKQAVGILMDGKTVAQTPVQGQTDNLTFAKNDASLRAMGITLSADFTAKYVK